MLANWIGLLGDIAPRQFSVIRKGKHKPKKNLLLKALPLDITQLLRAGTHDII
jgi:hypothetical protein